MLFLIRHFIFVSCIGILIFATYRHFGSSVYEKYVNIHIPEMKFFQEDKKPKEEVLDIDLYNQKVYELANNPIPYASTTEYATITSKYLWPVKTVYPNYGALIPFKRVIAYYGNLYSKQMGALGEYPKEEMLLRLQKEVKAWQDADPNTETIPALHYIAVTAQLAPGFDGKYRARMPYSEIDKVLEMAKEINALLFIDIQVGLSDIRNELPLFDKYLSLPHVHLGVDPEFYMRNGSRPGTVVGTMDAEDINYVIDHLSYIVRENKLPPKMLIIHRFTEKMVTNYKKIKPSPEVQVVMQMDGWGPKENKYATYQAYIASQPVQFTGFKLFYKNDTKRASSTILTPQEVLKLRPAPSYIQYQ